jgi:hypothetical protein
MKLVNFTHAAKKFGIPRTRLQLAVEELGLKPVASIPHPRGTSDLFDEAALDETVPGWIEKQNAAVQAPAPTAEAVPEAASNPDVCLQIKALDAANRALIDEIRKRAQQEEPLQDLVKHLAAALGGVAAKAQEQHEALTARLDRLTTLVENLSAKAFAPSTINVVKPNTLGALPGALQGFLPPQTRLPRVVIVGGNSAQRDNLLREFGQLLDLRHIEGRDAKGKDFEAAVIAADHVVLMTRFIGHTSTEVVKNHKIPHTNHPGSVSSLHDTLTTLAVQLNEAKKAA